MSPAQWCRHLKELLAFLLAHRGSLGWLGRACCSTCGLRPAQAASLHASERKPPAKHRRRVWSGWTDACDGADANVASRDVVMCAFCVLMCCSAYRWIWSRDPLPLVRLNQRWVGCHPPLGWALIALFVRGGRRWACWSWIVRELPR